MSTIANRERLTPPLAPPAPSSMAPAGRARAVWQWLRRAAPTAAVLGALAGLAVWGHGTDWTLPKFSTLVGGQTTEVDDWCQEHSVPETQCIECDLSLVAPGRDYGWCKEHGVAQCPLEHPDVAQVKTVPLVSAVDRQRAQRALALLPRRENNSRCQLHRRRIQFASTQAVDKVGIKFAVVQKRPVVEAVVANGEVVYDQTCLAHLASRVAGTVWRVEKQVGDRVRQGDVLALIDASDVGRAKSELLQAMAHLRLTQTHVSRLKPLATEGTVAGRQLLEAEAAFEAAKIRLLAARQALVNLGFTVRAEELAELDADQVARRMQFLGLPSEVVDGLDAESTTSNLFPLRSPLDGVVVDRAVVAGEVVDPTKMLFGVANVERMWLTLDVRQEDVKYLSLGQGVVFRPSDSRDEPEIHGSLSWISTSADEQTRTVKVRADLPNAEGRLRANTFGTGRIVLRDEPEALVVPSEAVHWDGCCSVVFVRDRDFFREGAPKFFHIRKVRLGVQEGETTEIIAGLAPGEVIASKNSVVLEAELLKGNLGAGCCEVPSSRK